jgi:P27 family predicted phage terminase small subunit
LKNSLKLPLRRQQKPPAPPSHLTEEAKTLWVAINAEHAIDDKPGLLILTTACEAFDRMRQAQAAIAAQGITTRDRWGQVKNNPATVVERDSRAAMLAALRQLALDIEPPVAKGTILCRGNT